MADFRDTSITFINASGTIRPSFDEITEMQPSYTGELFESFEISCAHKDDLLSGIQKIDQFLVNICPIRAISLYIHFNIESSKLLRNCGVK